VFLPRVPCERQSHMLLHYSKYSFMQWCCVVALGGYLITVVYLCVIIFSLNSGNVIILIVLIELLSWLFSLYLNADTVLKYLLVQNYFSLLRIPLILFKGPLLAITLILKMGLPPFQLWVISLVQKIDKRVFLFFVTLHKLVPFLVLGTVTLSKITLVLGRAMLLLRGWAIFSASQLVLVLLLSSFVHARWLFLLLGVRLEFIVFYWVVYSIMTVLLFLFLAYSVLSLSRFSQNSLSSLAFLILSGLPPFTVFWLKVRVLYLLLVLSSRVSWIFLMVSVIALRVYYYAFHVSCFPVFKKRSVRFFLPLLIVLGVFLY